MKKLIIVSTILSGLFFTACETAKSSATTTASTTTQTTAKTGNATAADSKTETQNTSVKKNGQTVKPQRAPGNQMEVAPSKKD